VKIVRVMARKQIPFMSVIPVTGNAIPKGGRFRRDKNSKARAANVLRMII
jgi:hypothetical protein